jgi:hypothetical protein
VGFVQGIATPHASARSTWCAPLGVWHVERMKINGAEVDTKSDASLNTSAVRIASLLRDSPLRLLRRVPGSEAQGSRSPRSEAPRNCWSLG